MVYFSTIRKFPDGNLISWRGNTAFFDGNDVSENLSGGMYDTEDHIEFELPMDFTTTLIFFLGVCWSMWIKWMLLMS